MLELLDTSTNKNNRVIVAQFAQERAIANTPHSPRSNDTVPQTKPSVKQFSVEETDVAKFKPIARQLMRNNQIDGDVEELAKVLKKSFIDVSNDDVGSYEGVMPAVKWLQKNAKETVRLYGEMDI